MKQHTGILFYKESKVDPGEAFIQDLHLAWIEERMARLCNTDISGFFYSPGITVEEIHERQDVFRDLCKEENRKCFQEFYEKIDMLRQELDRQEEKINLTEKHLGIFRTIYDYIKDMELLERGFLGLKVKSSRIIEFIQLIKEEIRRTEFAERKEEAEKLFSMLGKIEYIVRMDGNLISVEEIGKEQRTSYAEQVEEVFADFLEQREEFPLKRCRYKTRVDCFQEQILDRVAEKERDTFQKLTAFVEKNKNFIPDFLLMVHDELGFYLTYLTMVEKLREKSRMVFPEIRKRDRDTDEIVQGQDLALALRFLEEDKKVVANDFDFAGDGYLAVVTGPNQGGKTTFARMIGQIYYLARLGVMLPAEKIKISLTKKIYTHFERGENENLSIGKLEDDMRRIYHMIQNADPESLIIANELFSSTTKSDGEELAEHIIENVKRRGARIIYITFLEMVSHHKDAVTYVSQVDRADPDHRLFQIKKQNSDNRAYTKSLVKKYKVSYEDILRRVQHEI